MYCSNCGKEIGKEIKYCSHCGTPITNVVSKTRPLSSQTMITEQLLMCPKCKSTQLTNGKKGFSGGKAVTGAILSGGIGILAGTIGSNKTIITCLNCGHTFKPGEDFHNANRNAIKKQKEQDKINKSPSTWIAMLITTILILWVLSKCGII